MENNLLNYLKFVDKVTSKESKDLDSLVTKLQDLNGKVNVARLLTGGIGLASEGGEFSEIVKKLCFQGKPLNDEIIFHLKRELGDIIWYWAQACMALNLDPNDVIGENVHKLKTRYPDGEFDSFFSENRQKNDL